MNFLKNKAKTLNDIYQNAKYILNDNIVISNEELKLLDNNSKKIIKDFIVDYEKVTTVTKESVEKIAKQIVSRSITISSIGPIKNLEKIEQIQSRIN